MGRLAVVLLALALAYALALWQPVRAWYSDADKLAHGVVFAGVYLALAWALRWPALPLALLSLTLGAGVEAHQHFLPSFTPSMADWLADAAGVGLAAGCLGAWRGWIHARLRRIGPRDLCDEAVGWVKANSVLLMKEWKKWHP